MTMNMPSADHLDISGFSPALRTEHGQMLFEITENDLRDLLRRATAGDAAAVERDAATAVITTAVIASLKATNVLDAANGMIAALKESPLEEPLHRAYIESTNPSDWVLVGSKS